MPTLHVVPDPGEPDAVAVEAAAPHLDLETADRLPVRWFPCAEAGVGAAVRAHVLTALNLWAVDTDVMADAMVLVTELVTNVRDHSPSDAVGIRLRVTTDRVIVAVVEQALTDAPPGGRLLPGAPDSALERRPADRGRGLRILDSLAAEWGFVRSEGVTTTWFALRASAPAVPGRAPDIRRF